MNEMKERFQQSAFNRIDHYKISLDNYKQGSTGLKHCYRSLNNAKDLLFLKGKEFFDKEHFNPFQVEIKRRLQLKYGKFFYLRDLYNQYDKDILKQYKKDNTVKRKMNMGRNNDLTNVRLLDDWYQQKIIMRKLKKKTQKEIEEEEKRKKKQEEEKKNKSDGPAWKTFRKGATYRDSLQHFSKVMEMKKQRELEIVERKLLEKQRRQFKRIRLESPSTPKKFDSKNKKVKAHNRLGTVVVSDQKIKSMITAYLKRLIRPSLSISERSREFER